MAEESKDLTEAPKTGLLALPDADQIREIFVENFEGIKPTFPSIKIPSGGGIFWSVPGEEEPEAKKEITGVVIDHYPVRAYWPQGMDEGAGNQPPECSSLDAKHGNKLREEIDSKPAYGTCHDCQFAQWGTGKNGRGQACKKIARVFMLLDGSESIFPYLFPLPPTSGEGRYEGSFSTYTVKLGGKLKRLSDVRTKVKLIEDKNKEQTKYSKAQFFFVGDLTAEEKAKVSALRELLKPAMREKAFETEEAVIDDPPF